MAHDIPLTLPQVQLAGVPAIPGVGHRAPEVTFTLTAGGLHEGEGQQAGQIWDFQSVISDAISKNFCYYHPMEHTFALN